MTLKYLVSTLLEPISFAIFCLAIGFYNYTKVFRVRFVILILNYLIGFGLLILAIIAPTNSHLYSLIYLVSGLSFGAYFYLLFRSKLKKIASIVVGLSSLTYYINQEIIQGGEFLFPSVGFVITSVGIIILLFLFFHQLMTQVEEESLALNFDFWFICSQQVYQLGAFGIFLTYNSLTKKILPTELYIYENRFLLTYLWGGHNILLFLGSLIVLTGSIWIASKRKAQQKVLV